MSHQHSQLAIWAFVVSLASIVAFFLLVALFLIMGNHNIGWLELAVMCSFPTITAFASVGLAMAALAQDIRKKTFAFIGLALSCASFFLTVVLILFAVVSG